MKASVYIATSLDGFIARENGDLDWLSGSDSAETGEEHGAGTGEDFGFKEFLDSIDTLVMGRKTFDVVVASGQWPYGSIPVVVLSSGPVQIPNRLIETVESQSAYPTELVEQLSKRGAKHIYVDGGKTIQGFLSAGLIQHFIITRVPVLIGKGIPLFGSVNGDIMLQHVETRSFPNGFIQSKYDVHE